MPAIPDYVEGVQGYTDSKLLAANVPEIFTIPTDAGTGLKANRVVFGSPKATDFYAEVLSSASDVVTNGAFAEDESWTKGTGWTIGSGVATATGDISTALEQTATLVEGQDYYVTFTATRSAGSVTVSIGGTNGTARSTSATFSEIITAGSTQVIAFTGTGFSGTIDDVTVIPCAKVGVDASAGYSSVLNPPGFRLGGDATAISVVSAGTPVITASFYK